MGEVDFSYGGNANLGEESMCGPLGRGEGVSNGDSSFSDVGANGVCVLVNDRNCEGCEAQTVSETACSFISKSSGAVLRMLDGFHNAASTSNVNDFLGRCNGDANKFVEKSCFLTRNDNGASANPEDCSEGSAMEWSEREEGCGRFLGVEEDSGHCVIETEHIVGKSSLVRKVYYGFPCLSPLRTLGGDGLEKSSGIGIKLEEGRVFSDEDGDCNGCEDAVLFFPGIMQDCPLMYVNGDATIPADLFRCPASSPGGLMVAATNCDADRFDERCGNFLVLKPGKMTCSPCSSNMLCSNGGSREENLFSLGIAQGLSIEHMGAQTEQREADAFGPSEETCTSLPEVVEVRRCQTAVVDGEFSSSVQGSPNKETLLSEVEGSTYLQSSHLLIAAKDRHSKPLLALDHQGERDSAKSCSVSVFGRTNPERVTSSKSAYTDGTCGRLTRTRSSARNCRQAVNTGTSYLSSTIKLSTRKRSCSHKFARLSIWGAVENLIQIFKPNDGVLRCDLDTVQFQKKRSKRGRSGIGWIPRRMGWKDGNSRVTKTTCATLLNSDCLIDLSNSKTVGVVEDRLAGDECGVRQVSCLYGNFENPIKLILRDGQHGVDMESTVTQETSLENMLGDSLWVSSRVKHETLAETIEDRLLLDPGTSLDSFSYHPIIDIDIIKSETARVVSSDAEMGQKVLGQETRAPDDLHTALSTASEAFINAVTVSPLDAKQHTTYKKGKKSSKVSGCPYLLSDHLSLEENLHGPDNTNMDRKPLRHSVSEWDMRDGSVRRRPLCSKSIRKTSRKGKSYKGSILEFPLLEVAELGCYQESLKVEAGLEIHALSVQDVGNTHVEASMLGGLLVAAKTKGCKLRKSTKAGGSYGKPIHSNSARYSRRNAYGQKKESVRRSDNKSKTEENQTLGVFLEAGGGIDVSSGTTNNLALTKSAELNTHVRKNTDKEFADCSIPQEKTNAEINAELEISDASCKEEFSNAQLNFKGFEPSKLAACQRASWTHIKSNLFLHRSRKTQTIDEIMVCHCKPPLDGSLGCGDECLNRMLNIECDKGTCPCGDLCSNQQFQECKFAKLKSVRSGKKGYGVQLQENVSRGKFLIEYVGEVIDACAKGNLGRFINHSCHPNCSTEKWMVNGEVCIGLFAIMDIKKGEEVTFDYNYVRVFGAAAKKCICGSSECRGYIGGDPLTTEGIVQGDSDDECPEPVMLHEDGERELHVDEISPDAINFMVVKEEKMSIQATDKISKWLSALQTEDTMCRSLSDAHPLDVALQTLIPIQTGDIMCKPLTDAQPIEFSSQTNNIIITEDIISNPISDFQPLEISKQTSFTITESISNSVLDNNNLMSNPIEDRTNTSNSYTLAKSSHSSGTVKKDKSDANSLVLHKDEKVVMNVVSGRFKGVEGKLDELLDADRGISKRKDATKGYLKLLCVTAAEGDNIQGCASQSIRDLSLVLDALLKTKSCVVLVDIINKNGLQMLHNIMKKNSSNLNRIPILRKLLKVLEFLALKGIIIPELINKGSPCNGIGSFKESISSLTRHKDKQVQQIAWELRRKWIPRAIRKFESSDREDGRLDSHRGYCNWLEPSFKRRHDLGARDTDATVCVSEATSSYGKDIPADISLIPSQQSSTSAPLTDFNLTSGTIIRKRKSRWDQPSNTAMPDKQPLWSTEEQTLEAGSKHIKHSSSQTEFIQSEVSKQKPESNGEENISSDDTYSATNLRQKDIEAPPGFGSLCKDHQHQASSNTSVAKRKGSRSHLVEQCYTTSHTDRNFPSASKERAAEVMETSTGDSQTAERVRWSSDGFGKRFFRPQRWNNGRFRRCGPPWPRERNGYGFRGSTRNGMSR